MSSPRCSRLRARRSPAICATTFCWMPSCRSRSRRRRSSSCAATSRSREARQLVELLGELRGQAHVGDGCRGLAGDRSQQRALGVAVLAAAPRPDLDARRGSRRRGRGRTTRPARRRRHPRPRWAPRRARRPSTPSRICTHEASSPSRTASASRVSSSRGSTGLFELRAELAQHRELPLAVAEDGAVDPPLHPACAPAAGRRRAAS